MVPDAKRLIQQFANNLLNSRPDVGPDEPILPDDEAARTRRCRLLRQIIQDSEDLGLYDLDDDELTRMPTRREVENLSAELANIPDDTPTERTQG